MPSIYVHLSGRDVDRSLLEYYGKKIDDGHEASKELWPKKCPRCGLENPATGIYCTRCSCPLDERIAQELEEKRMVAEGIVAEVVQEIIKRAPELVEQILRGEGAGSETTGDILDRVGLHAREGLKSQRAHSDGETTLKT